MSSLSSLSYLTRVLRRVTRSISCRGLLTVATRFMAEKIMPLTQAVEAYDIFNAMKVQKVIFEADK